MLNFLKFNLNNYLIRHIQVMLSTLGQLWRQPVASVMTILVIGIALALPAGLFVLLNNVEQISGQWNDANQISLFLKQDVTADQAQQLATQLKQWPNISDVSYQSAQQSLQEFRKLSGLGNILNTLPTNPLPAVIVVKPEQHDLQPNSIGNLLTKLKQLDQVDQAQLDMAWVERLHSINQTLQRGISVLALLLSLSVLLVIGNTIRLSILNRQTEIRVLKLVGGTNAFVRRPFLYTGFWYGILGGLVAWLTLLLSLQVISGPVNQLASEYDSAFTLNWLSGAMFLMLPLAGIVLGVAGAWLSLGRHLDDIEPT